jgi:hypothetical protein
VGLGLNRSPGRLGDTPGPLRGKARRSAGGYFLAKKVSALGSSSGPVGPIEPVYRDVPICRVRGTAA